MSNPPNTGRPWTTEEDNLLKEAVYIYGENTEKWKIIATHVPGRTNKACRKRWLHSLSPFVKKTAWTEEEDRLLLTFFALHPYKWAVIARAIPGRTDDACSKRYQEALDPRLKKDEWTEEEDRRLLEFLERNGGPSKPKWRVIGQELNRSGLGCRNRWRLLERKKKNTSARQTASQTHEDAETRQHTDSMATRFEPVTDLQLHDAETFFHVQATSALARNDSNSIDSGIIQPLVHEVGPQLFSHGEDTPFSPPEQVFDIPIDAFDFHQDQDESEPQEAITVTENDISVTVAPMDSHFAGTALLNSHAADVPPMESQSSAQADTVEVNYTGNDGTVQSAPSNDVSEEPIEAVLSLRPSPENSPPEEPPTQHEPQEQQSQYLHIERLQQTGSTLSGIVCDVAKRSAARLSSTLVVANDPSILAYACGNLSCWPVGSEVSSSRFSTSGELSNHYKDQHMQAGVLNDATPFRCGLEGCVKGWKSVNGLQYHLQISKAHYRKAMSFAKERNEGQDAAEPTHANTAEPLSAATTRTASSLSANASDGVPADRERPTKKRKLHPCPHDGCLNEYKQLSGLRYHLLHGHAARPPVQLDIVPPAIARRIEHDSRTST